MSMCIRGTCNQKVLYGESTRDFSIFWTNMHKIVSILLMKKEKYKLASQTKLKRHLQTHTQTRQRLGARRNSEKKFSFNLNYKWTFGWLCMVENTVVSLFLDLPNDEERKRVESFLRGVRTQSYDDPPFNQQRGRKPFSWLAGNLIPHPVCVSTVRE